MHESSSSVSTPHCYLVEPLDSERILASYLTLRRAVGVLAVSAACAVSDRLLRFRNRVRSSRIRSATTTAPRCGMSSSVSSALPGSSCSPIGVTIARDNIAGDFACLFAVGVALFPTTSDDQVIKTIHFVSAASLFLLLSYFSLFLFTKTKGGRLADPGKEDAEQDLRGLRSDHARVHRWGFGVLTFFSTTLRSPQSGLCFGWKHWRCGPSVGLGLLKAVRC